MAGKRKLLAASFRGVEFGVEKSGADGDPHGHIHKFPQRKGTLWEPLGEGDMTFAVEGFVVGDDWQQKRDTLERALREGGTGELVHPWRGRKTVAVTAWRANESVDEYRVVRFSITFLEQTADSRPTTRLNTPAIVNNKADGALRGVQDDFAGSFSVDGLPGFAADGALGDLDGATTGIERAGTGLGGGDLSLGTVASALRWFAGTSPQLGGRFDSSAFFSHSLRGLRMGGLSSLQDSSGLGGSMIGLMRLLSVRSASPRQAWTAQRGLWDYGADSAVVPPTTPTRARQAANSEAMAALVRRSALIESARATSTWSFDNYDEAAQARDELAERLDRELDTAPDPLFVALQDLKGAMVRDITTRGADLSRVTHWTPAAPLPAPVIAYEIYGDSSRDSEIVARNNVRHPAFVPGGQPLEILSDG